MLVNLSLNNPKANFATIWNLGLKKISADRAIYVLKIITILSLSFGSDHFSVVLGSTQGTHVAMENQDYLLLSCLGNSLSSTTPQVVQPYILCNLFLLQGFISSKNCFWKNDSQTNGWILKEMDAMHSRNILKKPNHLLSKF